MPPTASASASVRPVRADVARNLAALLDAAKTVFASSGVRAPAKEITDLAGVGVGTLYRHFPRRSDLITAVLRSEVEECIAVADALADSRDPYDALVGAIERYTGFVGTKLGLSQALHSDDPAYEGLPGRLLADLLPAFDRILECGAADGTLRTDLTSRELLVAVSLLSQPIPGTDDGFTGRLVRGFVEGRRAS